MVEWFPSMHTALFWVVFPSRHVKQVWFLMSAIPVLWRRSQKEQKLMVVLGYTVNEKLILDVSKKKMFSSRAENK